MAVRQPQILIVEDSDTMFYLYQTLLGDEYELRRATDGRQALLELVRVKPDLIILDWTLDDIKPWDEDEPDTMATLRARGQKSISGLEVLRVVKRSTFKTTPVIMLTGHKGFHEKLLGKLLRADKYLTKPLDETAFVQTVHALVPPVSAARRALTGARAARHPGERGVFGAGRAAAPIENT